MTEKDDPNFGRYAGAEWHAIVTYGRLGVRFGPFSGAETEALADEFNANGVKAYWTIVCGKDIDWEMLRSIQAQNDLEKQATENSVKETLALVLKTAEIVRDGLSWPRGVEEEVTAATELFAAIEAFKKKYKFPGAPA